MAYVKEFVDFRGLLPPRIEFHLTLSNNSLFGPSQGRFSRHPPTKSFINTICNHGGGAAVGAHPTLSPTTLPSRSLGRWRARFRCQNTYERPASQPSPQQHCQKQTPTRTTKNRRFHKIETSDTTRQAQTNVVNTHLSTGCVHWSSCSKRHARNLDRGTSKGTRST